MSQLTSYDEVPYESKPLFSTHPDCLAVAARLRGMHAPPPTRCRVLELGCAAGGNLIPMAYALPESRFVGIDLSQRQIADGQQLCDRLELPNIELRAGSIADIDRSWGEFDYIICHGVYSWVPPPIQEHILWVCKHLLSPQGVAHVSYNTYPGWHLRTVVRDLMKYHTARFDEPQTKVQQARSILQFMADASANLDSPMSHMLKEEAEALPEAADYYLYHEHLEDSNQPLYFHQFVAKARGVGLDYLGEAWHHTQIDNLPADVRETLQSISRDLIDLEQFVDFLRSRTFRRTLLCHSDAGFVQTPDPDVLRGLWISALARPQSAKADVATDREETFVLDDGTTATTNAPILKAALVHLYRRWPEAVPFDELVACACDDSKLAAAPAAQNVLAALLVQGYVSHLVAIHTGPFPFTQEITLRPRASRLARFLADRQARLPNLRHRLVELPPLERSTLRLADGNHTAEEIAAQTAELCRQVAEQEGWTPQTVAHRALVRLASSALLEG